MKPLKILLIGYGKMGKEVERMALERGHGIIGILDKEEDWQRHPGYLSQADVAIDFSIPASAPANIGRCFEARLPIVVGTTGWDKEMPAIRKRCIEGGHALFTASNFCIGIHVFLAAARTMASLLDTQDDYHARIEEVHHIHKLDKPSGTAVTLARQVLEASPRYKDWILTTENGSGTEKQAPTGKNNSQEGILPVSAFREGEIFGIHRLFFDSETDCISLTHQAKSRRGFALGAVKAAEWLPGKTGLFGMQDLLGF